MDKNKKSLDASFFNELYERNQDPWNFEESLYEKNKYEETMRMIPGQRYLSGFEIGCANGLLTLMLRQRCEQLLAVDASRIAVTNAKNRLKEYADVSIEEMEIPVDFPDGKFDLILFSEVGYFLNEQDLVTARNKMIDSLLPGGHLLLVHWRPPVAEFPLTGDDVHALFLSVAGEGASDPIVHLKQHMETQYRMDLFVRKPF
ncbi:SAM-dependent methyltransferase [Dyadobacter diqingensis]|uniref:SAM-dependent methyltransferase n=1 Tax=Dyadobacter diqingensis TaxID=2938121 RepID=UPI0020C29201|nr:SAM-dependent methyltransferase [Dyadobacter diqingensis]